MNNLPALLEQSVRFGFWVFVAMLIALVPPSWKFLPRRLALSTLFTAYCFMLFLFVYVLPKNEPLRGEKAFARTVRATARWAAGQTRALQNKGGDLGLLSGRRKTYPGVLR